MDKYDNISPLDFRYYSSEEVFSRLSPYLSERAFVNYQLKVELSLIKALSKKKICSSKAAKEAEAAIKKVKVEDIYEEDKKIKHYTKSVVNLIRKNVSDESKPFIHLTATSFDIFDTANALRFKDATKKAILPELLNLEKNLIKIAIREKNTLQIGRTHGQHAVPITFGFALSEYVSRIGYSIKKIKEASDNVVGKFSGAVGAYNASSLFFGNPEEFEFLVLKELGLKPATHSTQIVEPEFNLDLIHSIISAFGVLANLADDMRHLQRSEINEIAEEFEKEQVGSSTMPHKRNPWNFENVKSMWKEFMPRITTIYMDQISEHQRDLTNSASQRFMPEIFAGFLDSILRLNKLLNKLIVNKECMIKNFEMSKDMIIAEPLYILLSYYRHPNAHEEIRKLTLESQQRKIPLKDLVFKDDNLKRYLSKFNKKQIEIIKNPERYTGIAAKKAEKVCRYWEKELYSLA